MYGHCLLAIVHALVVCCFLKKLAKRKSIVSHRYTKHGYTVIRDSYMNETTSWTLNASQTDRVGGTERGPKWVRREVRVPDSRSTSKDDMNVLFQDGEDKTCLLFSLCSNVALFGHIDSTWPNWLVIRWANKVLIKCAQSIVSLCGGWRSEGCLLFRLAPATEWALVGEGTWCQPWA